MGLSLTAQDVMEGIGVWLNFSFVIVLVAHASGFALSFVGPRMLSRVLGR